jgi:hypothetical protein
VISAELFARRFTSDPSVVGRTVMISGTPFAIVGVAPPGFQGTTLLKPDMWVPLNAVSQALPRMNADLLTSRSAVWLFMGGRLAPGVSLEQANAELRSIGAALEREFPDANRGKTYRAAPTALFPGQIAMVAGFVGLLTVIVALVLLIA